MNFKRYHVSKNLFNHKRDKSITFTTDTKYYMIGAATLNDVNAGASVTITDSGVKVTSTIAGYGASFFIEVTPNTDYTISVSCNKLSSGSYFSYSCRDANGNVISGSSQSAPTTTQTITTSANAKFLNICLRLPPSDGEAEYTNIMLNTGSQPLPYEPYSSEVWHDIPHYIHNTSTDTLTTLPAVLYPNAVTATVGLKGQMEQSSTPSPTTPIQPSECGERTGNLVDYTQSETGGIDNSGNLVPATNLWRSTAYTAIDATLQYFVSWTSNTNLNAVRINYYTSDKTHISREQLYNSGTALTIPQNAAFFKWTLYAQSDFVVDLSFVQSLQLMINTGSTALPYEPYGIKIPISSVNTTTPVYLGEVQTERKIKKLVLTGEENILARHSNVTGNTVMRFDISGYLRQSDNIPISSHYSGISPVDDIASFTTNNTIAFLVSSSGSNYMYIYDNQYTSPTDFKAYLAAQYSAGTPVTVWYVLAEPTTDIVNEPLRKIGTYADEVSGITIPTIAGANTLSVDTTLQPSEVTVNYKGWHPVADVHERENGAWT